MGLLDRLRTALGSAATAAPAAGSPAAPVRHGFGGDPLVPLSGTNTTCHDTITALVASRGLPGGYLETIAVLRREPDNPVDPRAVAVLVDGERVGYLPGGIANALALPDGASAQVQVQLFTAEQDRTVRAEGWVWLGPGRPRWRFSAKDPAPVTREAKRSAEHTARRQLVAEAVAGGGPRAADFTAAMVDGVHYLELVEPIKQLKRDGRLEEALELCYTAIASAEKDPYSPPPFYTEQAAIVLRKLGRREEEIAVLRRYLAQLKPADRAGSTIGQRLAKLEGH